MKSLADKLPPDIARQVHADWRKNEAAYWAVRDSLLLQYAGQWIGFADGVVVASGTRSVEVLHAARKAARHPFVICVGREEEPHGIRRVSFAYELSYQGEPLPSNSAEFRSGSGVPGVILDGVIPDTGRMSVSGRGELAAVAAGCNGRTARADQRNGSCGGNPGRLGKCLARLFGPRPCNAVCPLVMMIRS